MAALFLKAFEDNLNQLEKTIDDTAVPMTRQNFTHGFWLVHQYGLDTAALSKIVKRAPEIIDGWAIGKATPSKRQRRRILQSAFAVLKAKIENGTHPMPNMPNHEDDGYAPPPQAQKPKPRHPFRVIEGDKPPRK